MNTRPATITASVSDAFLDKAPRLFNASTDDILNEMLQNARRAGASSVEITTAQAGDDMLAVTIKDNGRGIDDPSVLLRLAASGWDAATTRREDAAGMGLWSLAHTGAEIRLLDWRVAIPPEAFQGKMPVPVDSAEVHGPLGVEKLEGRQESGRDAQDDNEEDEPPD